MAPTASRLSRWSLHGKSRTAQTTTFAALWSLPTSTTSTARNGLTRCQTTTVASPWISNCENMTIMAATLHAQQEVDVEVNKARLLQVQAAHRLWAANVRKNDLQHCINNISQDRRDLFGSIANSSCVSHASIAAAQARDIANDGPCRRGTPPFIPQVAAGNHPHTHHATQLRLTLAEWSILSNHCKIELATWRRPAEIPVRVTIIQWNRYQKNLSACRRYSKQGTSTPPSPS